MRWDRPGRWWVAAVVCLSVAAGACSGSGSRTTPAGGKPAVPAWVGRTTGPFAVVLTAGHPAAVVGDAVPAANGDKLDPAAISAVVSRFPPFTADGGAVPFKRPPESLPRPRVGATITVAPANSLMS